VERETSAGVFTAKSGFSVVRADQRELRRRSEQSFSRDVLLALAETVDLVEEEDRAPARSSPSLALASSMISRMRATPTLERVLLAASKWPFQVAGPMTSCEGGLPRPGRPVQDDARQYRSACSIRRSKLALAQDVFFGRRSRRVSAAASGPPRGSTPLAAFLPRRASPQDQPFTGSLGERRAPGISSRSFGSRLPPRAAMTSMPPMAKSATAPGVGHDHLAECSDARTRRWPNRPAPTARKLHVPCSLRATRSSPA